jgi:hypothetical protein
MGFVVEFIHDKICDFIMDGKVAPKILLFLKFFLKKVLFTPSTMNNDLSINDFVGRMCNFADEV